MTIKTKFTCGIENLRRKEYINENILLKNLYIFL